MAVFTNQTAIEQLLTSVGVDLRTEDSPAGALNWVIQWATNQISFYVAASGIEDDLAANAWVIDQATVFAAYRLAGRGGELVPATLAEMYKEAKEYLELIRLKQAQIPGLEVAVGKGGGIVMSNFRVDMQRQPSVRVNRPTSTGQPAGYQQARDASADIIGRR